MLAASLNPNDTFLAIYEINSINTNTGNKPSGQPAGTNKEKNFNPCFSSPSKVAPITTLKLKKKANMKCDVEAKLYGIIPNKLFISIKTNKQ